MNGEDCFAFGRLFQFDTAAMLLCDLLREGESKPDAALPSLAHEG